LRFLLLTFLMLAVCCCGSCSDEEEEPETNSTPDIEIWLGEKVGRFGDYEFKVSGGNASYPTPKGVFCIEWKSRNHWSKQWDASMPYAQFFSRGAAIHKGDVSSSSHGCVRVPESAARHLFAATREGVTRVIVYP
jgi:lipoprotein-anchoring transpeptidase ErfK/SrfK